MSFESKNNMTATIEKPTELSFAELVDKKVEQNAVASNSKSEIERETERFENNHTAQNLSQVYREIDRETVTQAKEAEQKVSIAEQRDSVERVKKSKTYQDVVQTFENPTLEISEVALSRKSKKASKEKKLSSRMKLWITTGACCFVLLVGLVVCNALSIGAIEYQTGVTEGSLTQQEQVLDGVNGKISAESGKVPSDMQEMIDNGGKVDITPKVNTEIVTSDNFFNKLTKFISYLFGR